MLLCFERNPWLFMTKAGLGWNRFSRATEQHSGIAVKLDLHLYIYEQS